MLFFYQEWPVLAGQLPDNMYAHVNAAKATLGHLLSYDPVPSGSEDVANATVHQPQLGAADGIALSLREREIGRGPDRDVAPSNIRSRGITQGTVRVRAVGINFQYPKRVGAK